jgi:uncharacterized protein
MEKALVFQNKHWNGKKYSKIFERPVLNSLIEKISLKEIQVLLGIRRSGKSTLFKLLINHLLQKEDPRAILFINCEDPFYSSVWEDSAKLYDVVELAEKIAGVSMKYLFLDEVQVVLNWEKYVKSIYESGKFKKIFITGSNSDLLEGDYIRMLSGRYVAEYIYPLSFKEVLAQNNITDSISLVSKNPDVLKILDTVLQYGFFPEVYKTKDIELKRELLINYFETIVLKDCLLNNNIRDSYSFRNLANYLLTNIASVFSYGSLAKALKSNENTMGQYVKILESSYIVKELHHFSYSSKVHFKTKKKIFCIDNGLVNAISPGFSSNHSRLLENLVFIEILKMKKFQIFFYNEKEECDFILKYNRKLIAIQVVYELHEANEKRELKALEVVNGKFRISHSFIVTYNQNMSKNGINVIPFARLSENLEKMFN